MPGCRHRYARTSRGRRCVFCGRPSRAGARAAALAAAALVLLAGLVYAGTGIADKAGREAAEAALDAASRAVPGLEGAADSASEAASGAVLSARAAAGKALDAASGLAERVPVRMESGFDRRLVERHVYEMTNEQRRLAGAATLVRDEAVDLIAYGHSADMAARGYFAHDTPEGLDPSARGQRAGYECRKDYGSYYTTGLAENIFQSHTYSSYMTAGVTSSYTWLEDEEELARQMMDGWMDSPGHKRNILDPQYDRIGVGVQISPDEQVFATQNFC